MPIEARTSVVTVYPGDYLDRIRHLEQKAAAAFEAEGGETRTLAEVPTYLELAQQHDDLVVEAEEKATHLVVQSLPRKVWKALVLAHAPRTGEDVDEDTQKADAKAGFNVDTFPEALVCGGQVDVDGIPTEFRSVTNEDDLDNLADIDFDRVYYTAYGLNRLPGADPKASLVSQLTAMSVEISRERETSGSASGGTEAGSLPELLA